MVGESCDVFATRVLVVQTFAVSCVKIQALTHFIKVQTYLDEETAKEPFSSSSQAAICYYYSNH